MARRVRMIDGPGRRGRSWRPAAAPDADPSSRTLDWTRSRCPPACNPSALVVAGETVLVGGRSTAGGDRPGAGPRGADGAVRPLPLRPTSPYAKVADLSSLATDGRRCSPWARPTAAPTPTSAGPPGPGRPRRLTETSADLRDLRRLSAGGLLDVVAHHRRAGHRRQLVRRRRARSRRRGLAAARPDLASDRSPPGGAGQHATSFRSRRGRRPPTARPDHHRLGDHLRDGVQQSAAIWTWPSRDAPLAADSGCPTRRPQRGVVQRLRRTCWVAGPRRRSGGRCGAAARATPARETTLPAAPIDVDGPGPRTIIVAGRPGVLVQPRRGRPRCCSPDGSGWRTSTAPDGPVRDAVVIGNRLYAIARRRPSASGRAGLSRRSEQGSRQGRAGRPAGSRPPRRR